MSRPPENTGKSVHFKVGETIYQQGSKSTGVYMILDGRVDIWRNDGEQKYHIASIGEGELLGEVSVIERTHHSVTAKVSDPTTALFIEAEAFRRSFADPLVRHVVNTLAARLRSSYAIAATLHHDHNNETVPVKRTRPTIEGASRVVADKFLTFAEMVEFPFIVGNINSPEKQTIANNISLRIPIPHLRELADNHFEVIRRDGGFAVRDLGSPQGTIVNGDALNKYGLKATAKLLEGQNEIIAGSNESPVRFIVTIPKGYSGSSAD